MLTRQGIPSQEEADMNVPEEHFLWALRNLPTIAGVGAITHPGFLRAWSKHLWDAGFRHDPEKQTIKFQPAFRGPGHTYNNAARWVGVDTPDPEPFKVPNIRQMTDQENYALLYQLHEAGYRLPEARQRDKAQVEGNPNGR